jgi:hypothetical protein
MFGPSVSHQDLQRNPLHLGECFADIDYLFFQQNNAGAGTSLSVSYDLACQWAGNLRARDGGAYSAA